MTGAVVTAAALELDVDDIDRELEVDGSATKDSV